MHKIPVSQQFCVILVKPQNPANIGLVARGMKNTGFADLRLVGMSGLDEKTYATAVHSKEIIQKARFFPDVSRAVDDLNAVFAATSKKRTNYTLISLEDALDRIMELPNTSRIGLLFGNERTGLTSAELQNANFIFRIPQASPQPSYNLASAVLLTLFSLFSQTHSRGEKVQQESLLPRKEQEECIQLILKKLEKKQFIHRTNKKRISESLHDLFGRLAMTARDRKLLLALFSKGIDLD